MKSRAMFQVHLPSRKLKLGERTLIMGVLNVTPDSFYDGGKYFKLQKAIDRGVQIQNEGADILDVGGESTRPPRLEILPADVEIKRVIPVIERLRRRVTIPISIDTYKAEVARSAISAGAEIVNDIGGLRFDPGMPELIADSKTAIILMHSRGSLETMHQLPRAKNILKVVMDGLQRSIQKAMNAGIKRNQIIIDPGLGFSKKALDNLLLLRKLDSIRQLQLPILVGASRKSFLGKVLDIPVEERLISSLACVAVAVMKGAHIVRVHDVKETLQIVKICDSVMDPSKARL
jgi:dihydropteroate synthase